jgi:hypothetical protein
MKKENYHPEGNPFTMIVVSKGKYSYPVLNNEKLPCWDEEADTFNAFFDLQKKPIGLYKVTVQPMTDVIIYNGEYELRGAYYDFINIELICNIEMLEK